MIEDFATQRKAGFGSSKRRVGSRCPLYITGEVFASESMRYMNCLDASCWEPLVGRMPRMGIGASIGLMARAPAELEPLPSAELMGVEDEEEERFYIP